jgi:hypothetical protein
MSRIRSHVGTKASPGSARLRLARLWLETLEDRCVPAGVLSVTPFTSLNPQPTEGAAFTGQVATAFDTGPSPTFSISIDWGDGTPVDTSSGIATPISGSPNAFSIAGTHTYAEESGSTTPPFAFPAKVTVKDIPNALGPITVTSPQDVVDASLSQGNPVKATPSQTFAGGGSGQPTAAASLASFEAAIGGVKNTAAAPQTGGFRTITWDGVKTDGTDAAAGPNSTVVVPPLGGGSPHTVGIPLDRFEGSGVYFGAVYGVSNDGFVDVNPSVGAPNPVLFPAFSTPNTFAMFNDNGIDFKFVAPAATNTDIVSASSRGFGAIFINVEQLNTTSITYFNGNNVLFTQNAPVGGKGQPVFIGALFNNPVVTRVLLTLGTDVIFKFDGTAATAGGTDSGTSSGTNLVVTDDWAFAEPVPTPNGLPIVTGAQGTANAAVSVNAISNQPFTGTVASFSDLDPNGNAKDFTATINWGDGHLTNGTIKANTSGGFDVIGTNTYSKPGLFPINVDVADFGGGNGIAGSIPTVSINNTAKVIALTQTIGGFDSTTATFFLRNENSPGAPDAGKINFGVPGFQPLVGDWDGNGTDTIGVFDPSTATFFLRNENSPGGPDAGKFAYGSPGDIAVVGDWTGTGHDGIGVYDPRTGTWLLRNEVSAGAPDAGVFAYGSPGLTPVTGDWAGTGKTGIGVFDPTSALWQLRNEAGAGAPDAGTFFFGSPGNLPLAGDWTGAGHSGIGVFVPATATYLLRTEVGAGGADAGAFAFGTPNFLPVAGTYVLPSFEFFVPNGSAPAGSPPLTEGQLQGTVQAALARLSAAGVNPALVSSLGRADFEVSALPPGVLGLTNPVSQTVTISATASGQGWFVDPTPLQDEEFTSAPFTGALVALPGSPAANGVDLLTLVLHEMGHLAGLPDVGTLGDPFGLMADMLPPGMRRTGALDQVFAGLTG